MIDSLHTTLAAISSEDSPYVLGHWIAWVLLFLYLFWPLVIVGMLSRIRHMVKQVQKQLTAIEKEDVRNRTHSGER